MIGYGGGLFRGGLLRGGFFCGVCSSFGCGYGVFFCSCSGDLAETVMGCGDTLSTGNFYLVLCAVDGIGMSIILFLFYLLTRCIDGDGTVLAVVLDVRAFCILF